MATTPSMYVLHVQLAPLVVLPPVWRRLAVTGDCSLRRLHHFIQAAFGWESRHLHEFSNGIDHYLPPDPDIGLPEAGTADDRRVKVRHALKAGDRMQYIYDFGDEWLHVIAVETNQPCEITGAWCELLDGAGACPPEDVGGPHGYMAFLQSIHSPPALLVGRHWSGRVARSIRSCSISGLRRQPCSGFAIISGGDIRSSQCGWA